MPRILPLVWNGKHVSVVQVSPLMIASLPSLLGWARVVRVAPRPILDDIVIELLRPKHSGQARAHGILSICGEVLMDHRSVKLSCVALSERVRCVKVAK